MIQKRLQNPEWNFCMIWLHSNYMYWEKICEFLPAISEKICEIPSCNFRKNLNTIVPSTRRETKAEFGVKRFCSKILKVPAVWHLCKMNRNEMSTRVGTIGRDLIFLLTQCRHMKIDQKKSNTFLMQTSSNYFWA